MSLVGSQEVLDSLLQSGRLNDDATATATDREELEDKGVDIKELMSSLKTFIQQQPDQQQPDPTAPLLDPASLNEEQQMAFNLIVYHQEHNIVAHYDIDGAAGSGKTYFVKCTQQHLNTTKGEGYCRIAAPTGTAATMFPGGQTLHSLLKLPINGPLKPLTQAEIAQLQSPSQLGRLYLLIIDEKGQISLKMLGMVDERLREIFKRSKPFGGVSVLLSGI